MTWAAKRGVHVGFAAESAKAVRGGDAMAPGPKAWYPA